MFTKLEYLILELSFSDPHNINPWQTFSFVLGVIIVAAVAYREGWEAVLFLMTYQSGNSLLSIRQVISNKFGALPGGEGPRRKKAELRKELVRSPPSASAEARRPSRSSPSARRG